VERKTAACAHPGAEGFGLLELAAVFCEAACCRLILIEVSNFGTNDLRLFDAEQFRSQKLEQAPAVQGGRATIHESTTTRSSPLTVDG
jgi:hypothetical protein